tara:strand:- start:2739 stop:3665 length:927 start_codon:yes stop_codon:yes gene_type:complete
MSRRDARVRSKKWLDKAKDAFDMSGKEVRTLMRKANIQDLDSQNDIRTMRKYLKEQEASKPAPSPSPAPAPTPTPAPAPTPAPTPAQPEAEPEPAPQPATTGYDWKSAYEDKKEDYEDLDAKIGGLKDDLTKATTEISTLKGDVNKYKGYETNFNRLSGLYDDVVSGNTTLTTERDDALKKLETQAAVLEEAQAERDRYREQSVNQQLAGIRGGATSGGANQSSYASSGSLASGRVGYSSAREQSRDKELADYFMQEGGATDSVLDRGPVVELIDRQTGRGASSSGGRSRSMTTGAGTGSYYASRFGG